MNPALKYDVAKAAAIQPLEAVRLTAALRQGEEGIWLQTFADAPSELYSAEQRTSRDGAPVHREALHGVGCAAERQQEPHRDWAHRSDRHVYPGRAGAGAVQGGQPRPLRGVLLRQRPGCQTQSAETWTGCARVAAVFVDLDGTPLPAEGFHLQPTAVVESSARAFSRVLGCFRSAARGSSRPFRSTWPACTAVILRSAILPRVMRLPGVLARQEGRGLSQPAAGAESGGPVHPRRSARRARCERFPRAERSARSSGTGTNRAAPRGRPTNRRGRQARCEEVRSGTVSSQAEA